MSAGEGRRPDARCETGGARRLENGRTAGAQRGRRGNGNDDLLRGSLEAFSPWEILQWLSYRPGDCALALRTGAAGARSRAWLHLREGSVLGIAVERAAQPPVGSKAALDPLPGRLGAWLVEHDRLTLGRLRFALGLRAALAGEFASRPLGRLLVDCGFLAAAGLEEALKGFARECLAEVLGWKSGRFRLQPEAPSRLLLPLGERIEPLLLELSHAIDDRGAAEPPSFLP